MIYTVGNAATYEPLFEPPYNPRKLGRTEDYAGGIVWKSREEAESYRPDGYRVYGVVADWDRDTEERPNDPDYPSPARALVNTSPLVRLPDVSP